MDVITVYTAADIIKEFGIEIPDGAVGFEIRIKVNTPPALVFKIQGLEEKIIRKQIGIKYEGDLETVNNLICNKLFPHNREITDVTITGEVMGKYEIVTTRIEQATSSETLETLIKTLKGE